MYPVEYHRPTTLDEARRLWTESACYVAGGTDVQVRIKNGLMRPKLLISLRNISELRGIQVGETISVGAATPLSAVQSNRTIRERASVLSLAVERMGNRQIRNAGTLGGNLCNGSPCADSAPALLVLDAKARVLGGEGARDLSLASFFRGPGQLALQPGELLLGVCFAPSPPGSRSVFFKKTRVRMDLALVNLAATMRMDGETCADVRLAVGAVAPTPLRLHEAERLLNGQRITEPLIRAARERAEQAVSPISDQRASADYRRHITGVFVERAIRALSEGGPR